MCVCACSMQGQSKHHHGEIHYHYLKKYDSNFTVVYFLGIQWWQGMEKSLVCGMGTNFSPGILLTCFFVVGQQSCLSIVLQKSRLNKAIFSCAFQHKKSVLFSTEKAHTGVRRITVTVKDCNHPPRRVLTKCRKKEGTWSAFDPKFLEASHSSQMIRFRLNPWLDF